MRGLTPALSECHGKTVLDIGCAEGLISIEFAKAGATVHGIERSEDHLLIARRLSNGCVTFEQGDLYTLKPGKQYDIVLALGVAHKLTEPVVGIQYAAASSRDLVVIRMSKGTVHGILRSKRYKGVCDVNAEMGKAGFTLERVTDGPREEPVHYYRRVR